MYAIALALAAVTTSSLPHQQRPAPLPPIPLTRGMVITHSVRIRRGVYSLSASASLDSAVVTIRGNNITVDFDGAELRGLAPSSDPDMAVGVGVRIDGGSHVRVINARVRGYRIGLLARDTRDVGLIDNDFSYNWKPRLYSLLSHESLADWLSHHHDENEEWMRFGAGAFLSGVHGGEVRGNRIEQGMEGLMIERSDSLLIWNNTIEYNSGVGIGLYRSSNNRIMHNYACYNVRGFTPYYRRGQDSADLLMYEQSSNNIVAYNIMTHGGDGLFLWAGQSTMDTGASGANDNLFYANDFSYAVANAMEATFSRNRFIANRASASDYGLWGGYSYGSKIERNLFLEDLTGIAIEHGQDDTIESNNFNSGKTGINLWANRIEPSDWGYPKHRDTESKRYVIRNNDLRSLDVGMKIADTKEATATGNSFFATSQSFALTGTNNGALQLTGNDTTKAHLYGDFATVLIEVLDVPRPRLVEPLDGGFPGPAGCCVDDHNLAPVRVDPRRQMPRSAIMMDEWGPYNWRYPRIARVDSLRDASTSLLVSGPSGNWRVVSSRNVSSVAPDSGRIAERPHLLTATPQPGQSRDWSVTIEYRATDSITDSRGRVYAPRAPYRVTYSEFEPIQSWNVNFHVWTDASDPVKQTAAFNTLLASAPVATRTEDRLDYMWYAPPIKTLPQSKWAAVATSHVSLPSGDYTLRSISDDGVRVYVDGKLVINNWTQHESAVDNAPISAGPHDIRVEYYQVDGWTELRVEIVKGVQRSTGSPGPH